MSDYTVDFSNDTCKFLEDLVPNTISRRDYFAAHALIGLSTKVIINGRSNPSYESQIANDCVFLADALIAELDKKDKAE